VTSADDVVDAFIHEATCGPYAPCLACVQELQAHINAALAIHRPCHTDQTPPWKCERSHYGDMTVTDEQLGKATEPAVCIDCIDVWQDRVPWPCPTARALGALPDPFREDHPL
jgi:hypothetical protein